MANIAQAINVLQAVILTEGEKIVLTPTYHVFNMYKIHQDAELIPIEFENIDYKYCNETIPQISASCSVSSDNKINITVCNLHPEEEAEISFDLRGETPKNVAGSIITSEKMDIYNDFDEPNNIIEAKFDKAIIDGNSIKVILPAKSIVLLRVKQ